MRRKGRRPWCVKGGGNMGSAQGEDHSGWWSTIRGFVRTYWKMAAIAVLAFAAGGGLIGYLDLGLSWRRMKTEEAEKGLHLYPQPRFLLERGPGGLPRVPVMQVQTWFLDEVYLPREGRPAEAPIVVEVGIGNPFSIQAVVVNDGDADAISFSVEHFYLLFDRHRRKGTFLAMHAEEGERAREPDVRRPGVDWIYERTFGPRESIRKPSIFPVSEFNARGEFLDIYWFKARYYRLNDPKAYSVEEAFVYDNGKILKRTDIEHLDEFGALDASIQKIVREHDL